MHSVVHRGAETDSSYTEMVEKVVPRLREFVRISQDAGSRNLGPTFLANPFGVIGERERERERVKDRKKL